MTDVVYIIAVIAFFAMSWAFALLCVRLSPKQSTNRRRASIAHPNSSFQVSYA